MLLPSILLRVRSPWIEFSVESRRYSDVSGGRDRIADDFDGAHRHAPPAQPEVTAKRDIPIFESKSPARIDLLEQNRYNSALFRLAIRRRSPTCTGPLRYDTGETWGRAALTGTLTGR
jgi:hypothetical protein